MKTVIVSRTRMKSGVCVGGLLRDGLRNVRLLPPGGGHSWPEDAPFRIGEVWDLDLAAPAALEPPHVEDQLVGSQRRIATQLGLGQWLGANVPVWTGDVASLFDGVLRLTAGGAGYVCRDRVSVVSVGFWRPDHDLAYTGQERPKYQSKAGSRDVHIAYVGAEEPLPTIPAGTLTRVSLSRWAFLAGVDGCWLQLSGCYPVSRLAGS